MVIKMKKLLLSFNNVIKPSNSNLRIINMKKLAITLITTTLLFISCSEDNIVPTTGNVIFIDSEGKYLNEPYYVVSETYFLTVDNPYWYYFKRRQFY